MPDFSTIFHHSSKDPRKGSAPIPERYEDWPEEFKTTYYKAYPRLPKIKLPDTKNSADFYQLIRDRKSERDFSKNPLSLKEISILLKYSCGNFGKLNDSDNRKRRAQPSGGARFPIEVYPLILSASGFSNGLYHYNVRSHELDSLWSRSFHDEDIRRLFSYDFVKNASAVFIMTAVFERNQRKYGERGYRQVLIEAGHIGQNIYLTSQALKLKCCALSGTKDEAIEKLLDIDGVTESVVYAVAVGK